MMKKLLTMNKAVAVLALLFITATTTVSGQLVVSAPPAGPNYTALVQNFFVGQGVTISNVTYTGAAQAIGSFTNANTNLGLTGGIIMTTGNRDIAIGPNNAAGAGSNLNRPGLPELNAQAGATTYDGAVLQFDFVAQSTSVSFQYIWASEEYPEYVNAGYNDAFAFFISGPGFPGNTNIALVPGTSIPITIDNVNGSSYSQYYVNNAGGQSIQYDGFTTTMTATATVQPCQTYTLRLCIADAGDHIYDSAVFLGQNSLTSNSVTVSAGSGYNGSSNGAYEGCLPGYLNFSIPQAQNTPFTFNYIIGGTAQNGVDYQTIPTSVTIPAGQTSAQVVINATNDNTAEGQETVVITVNNLCSVSTTTVVINDVAPLAVNAGADQLQCGPPTAATLTATPSGGLPPYTYSWSNGTTVLGTTASITNTPTATTTYTVTVTDACGTTVQDQVVVTVNPIPTSTFTASASSICAGQPLSVTYAGNANSGATYNWSVNNGATISGSGQGPVSVIYPGAGSYTISLIVSQGGCTSASTSVPVTVNPQPNSPFSAPTSLCTGSNGTFNFTGTVIPGATYTWNFSGGTVVSGSGQGPYVVNWATAGAKNVSLTVAANGCTSTTTNSVNVIQTPTSSFTATSPLCVGQNGTITYTGTQINGATYTWGFNGGTVVSGSGVGPYSVNWATAGTKNVTLTVVSNGCTSTTTTLPVTINAIPSAAFTASGSPICNGQPLTVTAATSGATTYAWSVNNGASISGSGQGPVTVSYPAAGTYTISLAVTSNGCTSATNSTTVTVNPQPSANFTAASPLCTGVNGTISYNAVPVPGANYTWGFNGGNVVSGSGLGPYSVNWSTAGTKTVTLNVSANGCSASSSSSVVVNQTPTSTFTVNNAQFCAGANATVTFSGLVIPGATYNWNFAGGTVISGSGVGPYQISWSTAGVKNITLSVSSNGCTSTTTTVPVTIYQVPTSTFSLSSSTICAGQPLTASYSGNASSNATYTWSASNGATVSGSGQGPVTINYPSAGSYNITLNVAENGCSSTTTTVAATVNPQPTANFTAPTPICTGVNGTITYNGTQIPGATYTWNFNGATVVSGSGAGPYSVNWGTAGTKTVNLTVAAAGCTATSSATVVVNQMPTSSFTVSNTQFCAGANATITFNGVVVPGATYTWNFNGGTVVSGSGVGPYTVNWSTAGTKNITLTVSANGCTSTTTIVPVTVYQIPTSTFTASAASVCNGSPISFTYSGNASPNATYTWSSTNGGSISGSASPYSFNYPGPGSYSITLNVSENGCSSTTSTVPVTVYPIPSSAFSLNATQYCAGANATVTYNGTPIPGATYTWNFNGGTVVSGSGVGPYTVNWSTAGTKTVTLTVSANGCTSTVTSVPVTIYQVPTSTFTLSSNSVCDGSPVNITYGGNASPNATYSWTVSNNGSVGTNPLRLIYPAPGTYTIGLTVSENGCSSTTTNVTATVKPMPTSAFTVSNTQFCAGANATITYTGTQITGATYNWSFSGGTVVSGSNAGPYSVNWSTPGVKNITLTVSANGCTSTTTTVPVTIYQVPTSTITASANSVCNGSPVSISYGGNASPNATFNWTVNNGGSISGTSSPYSLNYPGPNSYSIGLTVTENGCSSTTTTIPVTVNPIPSSAFSISNSQFCAGANGTISYNSVPVPGANYAWNFDGGTVVSGSGLGPYTIHWNSPGTKNVTLTVSANGCTSTTTTVPVTIYQVPTATFTTSGNSVCDGQPVAINYAGNASPNANYNWTVNNGGSISGSANPYSLNYPSPNSYTINLIVTENGCSSTTGSATVVVKPQPTASFTAPQTLCTGVQGGITYTGNGVQGAGYTWNFSGATVASGSGAGPYQLSWSTPGLKLVTLTVAAAGCSASASDTVVVNQMPTSTFTVSASQLCSGNNATVTFNGVQVQGANYTWNFAGGNVVSGSGMGPYVINWTSAGVKNITLTVSANGCTSSTTTIPVTIYQIPTSSFTTSAAAICNGDDLNISYNGNASPNANYSWSVNNGASVVSNPLQLNYPGPGTYNITLNVSENGCSSASTTIPVTVYAVPTANFTVQGPICEGASVNVIYTGSANVNNAQFTWNWDGGIGTNTGGENYAVLYSNAGAYTLGLSVTENGCTSISIENDLVVNAIPTSTFIATSPVCTNDGSVVTYTGNATPGATYAWTFDNGVVNSGQNQGPYNISWDNAGTKTLKLIVTQNGCTSPQTIVPVNVIDRPTADFSVAATSVCLGQPVTITYNGTGSPNAIYNWTATGGSTVTNISGNTYQLGYPGPGQFNITLSVTENGCASANPVSVSVTVNNMPTSAFVSSGSPMCDGQPLNLTYQGNASPNAQFIWNVNGGATISGTNPSYSVNYPGPGQYNISLTVSENGCTSTLTNVPVTIYQTPTSAFVASNNPVCNGYPVVLTYQGNASPNATYSWDVSSGASIIPSGTDSFSLEYPGAGEYALKLIVSENGCSSAESSDTISVFDVPVSAFVAVQNPVCDGQPVILNYDGIQIPGAVYTWTTPDSVYIEESGLSSYEVIYPGAGTYNISLKVTANGCPSDTTTVPVVVNATPTAPFNANLTVCAGANGNVVYTGPQNPGYSYQWNFDGGIVSSGSGPGPYSVSWANAGNKEVSLIVTSAEGCSSDTASVAILVNPIPSSAFTVSGTLCTNMDGSAYYTGAPLQNAQYTWNFGGADVLSGIAQGPYQFNYNTPGTKFVSLVVSANGCLSDTTVQPIVVNPVPSSNFSVLDSTVCDGEPVTLIYNGNASPNADYAWFTTGGSSVVGNGPFTLNYPSAGTFYVTLTVTENGCSSNAPNTIPVTVMALPNAYFTVPVGECFGANSYNFLAQGNFTWQANIGWNFGPNASQQTANIINPSNISFNTLGIHPVTLTVEDKGCTSTFTDNVQVYPDPQIVFSADIIRGCSPLEVQFTDLSGYGDLASYVWHFGDGDTSTLQNPIHIYDSAGTYSVTLDINFSSACGGTYTQSALINVYPSVTAGFDVTPQVTDIFNPQIDITGYVGNGNACYYVLGDGDTLMNTINGSHSYSQPGVYTIIQYVSNNFGCTDTAYQTVRIEGQPTIYVPNAFTPNNDGVNDAFGAKGTMIVDFKMYIFNRWGQLIFTGNNIDDYWDGSDPSGKRSPNDVYVYKIYYTLADGGDEQNIVGGVSLVD